MIQPQTFLFDVGKVLLDFDFETSLKTLLPLGTQDAEERLNLVLENKDSFERGDIALDDYVDHSLVALGPEVTKEKFFHAWRDIFTPNLPMWDVVETLKANGHRLLLFSNTNSIHCPWFLENYPIFDLFEAGTYSFEAGSMKPETKIYEAAIKDHNLTPEATLYIDDLPANIATGKSLGFRSHQYDLANHGDFERWLENELSA